MIEPWVEIATSILGGDGFNVYICFSGKNGFREIPLLEENTTFDKAKERGLAVAKDVSIKVYHRFGKDGVKQIYP